MTSPEAPTDLKSESDAKSLPRNGHVKANSASSEPAPDSDDGSMDEVALSKKKRLSGLTRRAKAKTKRILKIDSAAAEADSEDDQGGPMNDIEHDPAFNPSQLTKKKHMSPTGAAEKTKGTLKTIGTTIAHPKEAIKSKITETTAGQLSKSERPFLSKKADQEYLEAHDNLKREESTSSSKHGTSEEEQDAMVGSQKERIRQMESHRESLQAAWTTRRHVRRVRVVPKRHIDFPENVYFAERDGTGRLVRYDWLKWLGYNLIYYTQDFSAQYVDDFDQLPFSVDSSRHYVERLIMASAPWQSWAVNVRSVYRWEKPKTTGKWFALYVVLWYTENIIVFLYGYIIYIVLKERFYPSSAESIRSSIRRTQDSEGSANKFGELIDKHGRGKWIEPLMAELGPYLQLQLGDIANMLEVFANFYHWKSPRKTTATLCFFASCLLVSLLTDIAFCMKIVYFVAGGSFFLCFPIASRYPKYRYLVSPFKWVLWDIPTDAEWSLQYLRRQAQAAREEMINKKVEEGHSHEIAEPAADKYTGRLATVPKIKVEGDEAAEDSPYDSDDSGFYSASSTASVLESSDIRSFRTHCEGVFGRFVVFSKGIRFVHSLKKKELWRYDFLELVEMRKAEGTRISKIVSSPDQLEIRCIDGSRLNMEGMKERDEAFNTVIAFSSLQWQSLQIREDTSDQEQ